MTWDELTTEMNARMQFPGWTNAWTMPIKTRVDMLTTGVRTPRSAVKVFGTDSTRSSASASRWSGCCAGEGDAERALRGTCEDCTSTSSPGPSSCPATGGVADIEQVIGGELHRGTPIGTTIEGRNRFSITSVPPDLRSDSRIAPPRAGAGQAQDSFRCARSPTSRWPAGRPWFVTRLDSWSGTCTSTLIRGSATSALRQ